MRLGFFFCLLHMSHVTRTHVNANFCAMTHMNAGRQTRRTGMILGVAFI